VNQNKKLILKMGADRAEEIKEMRIVPITMINND